MNYIHDLVDTNSNNEEYKYVLQDVTQIAEEDIGPVLRIIRYLDMDGLYEYLVNKYDDEKADDKKAESMIGKNMNEQTTQNQAATKIQVGWRGKKGRINKAKVAALTNVAINKAYITGLLTIESDKVKEKLYKNVINKPCNFTSRNKIEDTKDGEKIICKRKGFLRSKVNMKKKGPKYCMRKSSYCWRNLAFINRVKQKYTSIRVKKQKSSVSKSSSAGSKN